MADSRTEALSDEEIAAEITRQQESNWERVTLNQVYMDEIPEFFAARDAYALVRSGVAIETIDDTAWIGGARVVADLGSTRDLDADACNLTRYVEVEVDPALDGDDEGKRRTAIVKVVGHAKEPGEGRTLAAMRAAGVNAPELLGYAEIDLPNGHRAVVVVTEHVEGTTVNLVDDPRPALERALELVDGLAPLRTADVKPASAHHRTFADRMGLHFSQTMPNLERHGVGNFEQRANVLMVLEALSQGGHVQLLHGDPAPVNWIRTADGSLVSFAPRGEIYGTRECDVAAILVQHLDAFVSERGLPNSHGQAVGVMVDETVAHCAALGETLDPVRLRAAMGVHLVLWSGYGVPSPERTRLINEGERLDDEFADPTRLKAAKLAAWERHLTGYECMKDFMRTPAFAQVAAQHDVGQSLAG